MGRKMDTVFVLLIISIFAASSLIVLLLGSKVYTAAAEKSRQGQDERTCLAYLWTKIKNNDRYGQVGVGEFNGLSALRLEEESDGTRYDTWIYWYDGWVCELYSEKGLTLPPESGTQVIKADSLNFTARENGLIAVETEGGSLLVSPRGKGGVPID